MSRMFESRAIWNALKNMYVIIMPRHHGERYLEEKAATVGVNVSIFPIIEAGRAGQERKSMGLECSCM